MTTRLDIPQHGLYTRIGQDGPAPDLSESGLDIAVARSVYDVVRQAHELAREEDIVSSVARQRLPADGRNAKPRYNKAERERRMVIEREFDRLSAEYDALAQQHGIDDDQRAIIADLSNPIGRHLDDDEARVVYRQNWGYAAAVKGEDEAHRVAQQAVDHWRERGGNDAIRREQADRERKQAKRRAEGERKLDWIQQKLARGESVQLVTAMYGGAGATRMGGPTITSNLMGQWEQAGQALLKVGPEGDLMMATGRKRDPYVSHTFSTPVASDGELYDTDAGMTMARRYEADPGEFRERFRVATPAVNKALRVIRAAKTREEFTAAIDATMGSGLLRLDTDADRRAEGQEIFGGRRVYLQLDPENPGGIINAVWWGDGEPVEATRLWGGRSGASQYLEDVSGDGVFSGWNRPVGRQKSDSDDQDSDEGNMAILKAKPSTLFRDTQLQRKSLSGRTYLNVAQVPDTAKQGDYIEFNDDGRSRLGRLIVDPTDGVAEFRNLELGVEQPNAYAEVGKRITEYVRPQESKPDYSFGEISGVDGLSAMGIEIEDDADDPQPARDPAIVAKLSETLDRWRKQQSDELVQINANAISRDRELSAQHAPELADEYDAVLAQNETIPGQIRERLAGLAKDLPSSRMGTYGNRGVWWAVVDPLTHRWIVPADESAVAAGDLVVGTFNGTPRAAVIEDPANIHDGILLDAGDDQALGNRVGKVLDRFHPLYLDVKKRHESGEARQEWEAREARSGSGLPEPASAPAASDDMSDPTAGMSTSEMSMDVAQATVRDPDTGESVTITASKEGDGPTVVTASPEGEPGELMKATEMAMEDVAQQSETSSAASDTDSVVAELPALLMADTAYRNAIANSDEQNARVEHDAAIRRVLLDKIKGRDPAHLELYKRFMDDAAFRSRLMDDTFVATYGIGGTEKDEPAMYAEGIDGMAGRMTAGGRLSKRGEVSSVAQQRALAEMVSERPGLAAHLGMPQKDGMVDIRWSHLSRADAATLIGIFQTADDYTAKPDAGESDATPESSDPMSASATSGFELLPEGYDLSAYGFGGNEKDAPEVGGEIADLVDDEPDEYGQLDKGAFDDDSDGQIDRVGYDDDGDGDIDRVALDSDGDGLIDTVEREVGEPEPTFLQEAADPSAAELGGEDDTPELEDTETSELAKYELAAQHGEMLDDSGMATGELVQQDAVAAEPDGQGFEPLPEGFDLSAYGFGQQDTPGLGDETPAPVVETDTDGDGDVDRVAIDGDGDGLVDAVAVAVPDAPEPDEVSTVSGSDEAAEPEPEPPPLAPVPVDAEPGPAEPPAVAVPATSTGPPEPPQVAEVSRNDTAEQLQAKWRAADTGIDAYARAYGITGIPDDAAKLELRPDGTIGIERLRVTPQGDAFRTPAPASSGGQSGGGEGSGGGGGARPSAPTIGLRKSWEKMTMAEKQDVIDVINDALARRALLSSALVTMTCSPTGDLSLSSGQKMAAIVGPCAPRSSPAPPKGALREHPWLSHREVSSFGGSSRGGKKGKKPASRGRKPAGIRR